MYEYIENERRQQQRGNGKYTYTQTHTHRDTLTHSIALNEVRTKEWERVKPRKKIIKKTVCSWLTETEVRAQRTRRQKIRCCLVFDNTWISQSRTLTIDCFYVVNFSIFYFFRFFPFFFFFYTPYAHCTVHIRKAKSKPHKIEFKIRLEKIVFFSSFQNSISNWKNLPWKWGVCRR